ncbi:MAG: hypothetical protein R3220_09985 [Balneolaceae bacterium]|nr:hypothetical protein [Balneolaceae bacterium]
MKHKFEDKEFLKNLRERLPATKYEDINKMLQSTGRKTYSEGTIRSVLNGNRSNNDIIMAAIDVAVEYEEIQQEKIKKLTKNEQAS